MTEPKPTAAALDKRSKELDERAAALDEREAKLTQLEADLKKATDASVNELEAREAKLIEDEKALNARTQDTPKDRGVSETADETPADDGPAPVQWGTDDKPDVRQAV